MVGPIQREYLRGRKLQAADVYDLRVRALDGEQHDRLAEEFEISQSTATRAIQGRTYSWVTHPVQWDHWEPGDPSTMRFMFYDMAQHRFENTTDITAVVEPSAPRVRMGDLLDILDEWEVRDEADGTAELRRQRIRDEQWRQVQALIARLD